MFIVPITGDKITRADGAVFSVLGYTNHKTEPAVYVQGPNVQTETISFNNISKLNGAPVKLTSGKVFSVATAKHMITLPQKDDRVKFRNVTVKVDGLKLNERGHLAAGVLIVGTNIETKEKITVRLANLVGIERANGDKVFNLKAFKQQYRDYLGAPA